MTAPPGPRRSPAHGTAAAAWWVAALCAAAAAALCAHSGGVTLDHAPAGPLLPPTFRGAFPPGCAWAWSPDDGYTYAAPSWIRRGRWAIRRARPPGCDVLASGEKISASSPSLPPSSLTTRASCTRAACTFTNLWHVDGAWYALVNGTGTGGGDGNEGGPPDEGWAASPHVRVRRLALTDPAAWVRGATAATIPGTTALLDYRFFLHPTAIGHWAEAGLGLAAALREGKGEAARPGRVVVLHAPRSAAGEWVRTALAAGLAAGGAGGGERGLLPPLHFQAEVEEEAAAAGGGAAGPPPPPGLRTPPGAPLEGVPPGTWLRFATVVVPREPPPGTPVGEAVGRDVARAFRAAFWVAAGVELPRVGAAPAGAASPHNHNPRPGGDDHARTARPSVLVLAKAANRRLLPGSSLAAALVASTNASSLTVSSFTEGTPLKAQLEALTASDLVVGAHTSALAAAALLPPGTAVLELLPWGWAWGGLDATFAAMAAALGDVRHGAWRGAGRRHIAWADARDAARFGNGGWGEGGEGCTTEGCVEAVTRADVVPPPGEVGRLAAELLRR
jgi:hypothetical protein